MFTGIWLCSALVPAKVKFNLIFAGKNTKWIIRRKEAKHVFDFQLKDAMIYWFA
jgi:hypothetical protein